ncbi:MAG: NAD(P)H-dependent oxidoreductase [Clostridiales bacterium]|jgi:multimeric flavodoxin WrbA|nr:NAD(P)H-dependent oxidoreductase [Clostridiales bacterium]
MKITLIHGQNHKGSTYRIARKTAEKTGGEIDEFFLPKDFSEGCLGCLACLHRGREYCPNSEKVGKIFGSMLSADVIIISSPTYVMEMTSHLKGFFEHIYTAWLAHRPEEAMFSKTAVVVSTAAAMGMAGVTKSMAKQMFYLGAAKVYRLAFRVMASDWDGISDKTKAEIESKTDKLARKIISKSGRVKPGFKTRFIFEMMRAFQKKNDYAPLDKEYWENKNWLGKSRPWKGG